ncbi:GNAT family N-acetyltransferase [Sphaerotilus hippei]|nr:GNAT family N-acetyltransferase [Sphaerotilus hippei]
MKKPLQALQDLKDRTRARVQQHQAQRRRHEEPLALRLATAEDLPAVLALLVAAGLDQPRETSPEQARRSWAQLHTHGGEVWLAERGSSLLGALTLFVLPLLARGGVPGALVEDVAVHPLARGQGVGRALMNQATERARAAGACKLALSSGQKRSGAHAFYDRLSHVRHGRSLQLPAAGEPAA